MKKDMISLVPNWAWHYDSFWQSVRRRNLWFIKLRYGAVIMLLFLLFTSEFFLNVTFSDVQKEILILITLAILFYNFILQYIRRFVKNDHVKFNPLHLSLIQMVLDLYALTMLVYYTGTIESPLYMLFIFHMIIGSLVLPGKIIYSTAVTTIVIFVALTFGEHYNLISHHAMKGLLSTPVYNDIKYVTAFVSIFTFVMVMSVILANRIAKQLYKMEQDLFESYDKLKASEEEKQRYIMAVVHEIKTPIAALHSYLDLILEKYLGPLNDKVEDRLKRARIRSDEAIKLIENVLKISKIRLLDEINKKEVDIKELICTIISKQISIFNIKKVHVSVNDKRDIKKKLSGDELLLDLAFSNLIGNAVKYVNKEGIVHINILGDENKMIVTVCDNGIGIPDKDQQNIFKDFYRASNIRKEFNGTGLGLSFVKHIVEGHKGQIVVESPSGLGNDQNPGCCFTVTLPYS
jgi:signal transduction histidine kinase